MGTTWIVCISKKSYILTSDIAFSEEEVAHTQMVDAEPGDSAHARASASIKSLQIQALDNSVRELDFASWSLAYNAVCLLDLTYGLTLS